MAKRTETEVRRRLRAAVLAASGKKAQEPVLLDVRKLADFCDYFFLCHGANPAQIQAIADAVEERLSQEFHLHPAHREGAREGEWRVLDYLDFIVHIFSARSRRFYDLERLWRGAPKLRLPAGVEEERAS